MLVRTVSLVEEAAKGKVGGGGGWRVKVVERRGEGRKGGGGDGWRAEVVEEGREKRWWRGTL